MTSKKTHIEEKVSHGWESFGQEGEKKLFWMKATLEIQPVRYDR
jgi:hypothetical protein